MLSGLFGLSCQRMSAATLSELVDRSTVIERDGFGAKVLQTPEGMIAKIFRRKRLLTTATFFPYARRFVRNARILAGRGIPTVTVAGHAYCAELARHVVTYHPLPGSTLRSCLGNDGAEAEKLLPAVAAFIATLHQQGVYFRSLHFGNIIMSPDEMSFGLIDVADMTIKDGPLSVRLRARNFHHLLRRREDAGQLQAFGAARFVENYLAATQLELRGRRSFLEQVGKIPAWSVTSS